MLYFVKSRRCTGFNAELDCLAVVLLSMMGCAEEVSFQFPFRYSGSNWWMLVRKLETLAVCMWYFKMRCGGRLFRTDGRLLANILHSVIRLWRLWRLKILLNRTRQWPFGTKLSQLQWAKHAPLKWQPRYTYRIHDGGNKQTPANTETRMECGCKWLRIVSKDFRNPSTRKHFKQT